MYVLTITVTIKNKERTDYIVKITYILYYKIARLVNRGKKSGIFFLDTICYPFMGSQITNFFQ